MLCIVAQNDSDVTILDTEDNTREQVSLEFVKILQDLISIANITEEKILLDKMLGIETMIFTEDDTKDTAKAKIKGTTYSKLKVYNFSNITDMASMFYSCKATLIDLSNFDTSKVTNMGSLKELNLSNFNTSKVENMYHMFYDCSSLIESKTIIPEFDMTNVTESNNMFKNCSVIPSWYNK